MAGGLRMEKASIREVFVPVFCMTRQHGMEDKYGK